MKLTRKSIFFSTICLSFLGGFITTISACYGTALAKTKTTSTNDLSVLINDDSFVDYILARNLTCNGTG
jgi:hypothetical protein